MLSMDSWLCPWRRPFFTLWLGAVALGGCGPSLASTTPLDGQRSAQRDEIEGPRPSQPAAPGDPTPATDAEPATAAASPNPSTTAAVAPESSAGPSAPARAVGGAKAATAPWAPFKVCTTQMTHAMRMRLNAGGQPATEIETTTRYDVRFTVTRTSGARIESLTAEYLTGNTRLSAGGHEETEDDARLGKRFQVVVRDEELEISHNGRLLSDEDAANVRDDVNTYLDMQDSAAAMHASAQTDSSPAAMQAAMDQVRSRSSPDPGFLKRSSERLSFKTNGRTSAGEPTLIYDISAEMDGGSDELSVEAALAGTLVVGTKPWRWITMTMEGPASFEIANSSATANGSLSATLVFKC